MTTEHKVILVLVLVFGIGASLSTYLVMQSRLEREVAATKSQIAQQEIDQLKDGMAKRESEFKDWKESFDEATSKVRSNADVARVASLPQTQGGIVSNPFRVVTSTDPTSGKTVESVIVPPDSIVPLYQNLRNCDAREKELGTCQVDKTDLTTALAKMTKDRDNWQQTANGGTKLQRVWFASRVAGCAGAGAAAGALSKNPQGAAIGAGVGALTCGLLMRH